MEGHVGDCEPAPVKVDRLWGSALEVSARETEAVLAIFASTDGLLESSLLSQWGLCLPNSFICHGTVIDIVYGTLELIQAKEHASTPRKHDMFRVLEIILRSPGSRLSPSIGRQIRALGKQQQPHRIEIYPPVGVDLALIELVETVSQARLVRRHLS